MATPSRLTGGVVVDGSRFCRTGNHRSAEGLWSYPYLAIALARIARTRLLHRRYVLDRETTNLRTQELLDFMQLSNETKKLVTDFSHGMQKKLALAAAVIHGPKVLFLDEPFEGVDAIAAGMLKSMLTGMINRGATIFLTTHVLEIVERLCSHVAIISKGRLVANGSLDELRAGVASTLPGAEQEQRLTLEEIFLSIVGAGEVQESAQELTWLT